MTDIKSLEGWLLKKKATKKVFSSSDVKRWFKVEVVAGEDNEELALCYYQSKQSKESKGWIFISDISEISEEAGSFTIVSPHRTMVLEAQTRAEHRHWMNGLTRLCPQALINGVAQQKESVSPMTVASKGSDSKYNRPGSGSRPNSSDSAAALDGSERIGPGKSGRHHNFDEDKSESVMRRSHDRDHGIDLESNDDRGRERRERGRENRESRDRGEDSDRGRDSSTERGSRHREDHRMRNDRSELSSHEATASARMHGHISRGDGNEERFNERSRPPDKPPSRPSSKENEFNRNAPTESRGYEPNDELEDLDINKPAQPSREARLQDRKERLRSSSQEGPVIPHQDNRHGFQELETAEDFESKKSSQDKKIRAPSGPRPPPRKAADLRDDDDDSDDNLSDTNRKDHSRPLASTEIDDLRNAPLIVNLDDSDDDGDEMDFKAEKRRYGTHASDDKSSVNDGTGSRPPRPPIKSQAKSDAAQVSNSRQANGKGSNFVTDDWDDDDEPVPSRRSKSKSVDKQKGTMPVVTGPRADSNWLDEDFDD